MKKTYIALLCCSLIFTSVHAAEKYIPGDESKKEEKLPTKSTVNKKEERTKAVAFGVYKLEMREFFELQRSWQLGDPVPVRPVFGSYIAGRTKNSPLLQAGLL